MSNTTSKVITTKAGEALIAQMQAENKVLVIDKFVFANVSNRQDFPQREDTVPTADEVYESAVHEQGRLTENSVIYSTTLASDVGPFTFNWSGLYCTEHNTLVAINYPPAIDKTVDGPGVTGNTLVRSFVLEYKGIAETTNITVDPESWQYNAHKRMGKMDNDTSQAIIDQNGKDWFIEDGFIVTPQSTAYNIKAGAGYVSGNRIALEFDRIVQVPDKPSFIYVDAWREGTPTGEWLTKFNFVVSADEKDDYTDAQGVKHFVCKNAQVLADGSVSDLRSESESADKEWTKENTTVVVSDIEELKKLPGIKQGQRISVLSVDDGLHHATGGGEFYWDEASVRTDSFPYYGPLAVIKTESEIGRWIRADRREYRNANEIYTSELARKLRWMEDVTIGWFGDSNSVGDGERVQKTFSEVLNKHYRPSSGKSVTVINRAKSGARANWAFSDDVISPNFEGDASVIVFGTNDALTRDAPDQNTLFQKYEYFMRLLVEREIQRGRAVVVVGPLPTRIDVQSERYGYQAPTNPWADQRQDLPVLRSVAKKIAADYGCVFVDVETLFTGYGDYAFPAMRSLNDPDAKKEGDPIHIKSEYKEAWGVYIAAMFIGDGLLRQIKVNSGDRLQLRKDLEPFSSNIENLFAEYRSFGPGVSFARADHFSEYLNRSIKLGPGDVFTYSFYADCAGLVVYPAWYAASASKFSVELNFSAPLPEPAIDPQQRLATESGFDGAVLLALEPGEIQRNFSPSDASEAKGSNSTITNHGCKLVRRGWHTLTFSVDTDYLFLSGLVFVSELENENYQNIQRNSERIEYLLSVQRVLNGSFDNITKDGRYYMSNAVDSPFSGDDNGYVEVVNMPVGHLYQEFTTVLGKRAVRWNINGWQGWRVISVVS